MIKYDKNKGDIMSFKEIQDKKNKIIGQNIKKIREINKMTQSELADKLKKTLSTVQRYEYGQITIPVFTLDIIADLFKVSVSDIIGEYETELQKEELIENYIALMGYEVAVYSNDGLDFTTFLRDKTGAILGEIDLEKIKEMVEDTLLDEIEYIQNQYENADDYTDEELERIKQKQGIYGDKYMEELTPREQNIWDNYVRNITYENKSKK